MNKTGFELASLVSCLKSILPLVNSHMVNFITLNMFENLLPKSIQEEIMAMSVDELNRMVMDSLLRIQTCNDKAPSLTTFLSQFHKISLKHNDVCFPFEKLYNNISSECFDECGFHKNLMSEKKSHEVEMMSSIIAAIAKNRNYTHIVDVGGGKGYLGSILALKHQLKVLSIDSSLITSKGAAKQIPKFEKLWKIQLIKSSKSNDLCNQEITTSDMKDKQDSTQFCKLATLSITEDTDVMKLIRDYFEGDKIGKIMLVGLHTCGNLAASSLRLFAKNPDHIGCLINVGCCYHLITEEFDTNPPWLEVELKNTGIGFPMSSYLRDMGFVLGRNARMLAAQPPDKICHEGTVQTESLFYRALLELYLEKKLCPPNGLPHLRVGKIAQKCSSFVEYVHKSVKRLGLSIQIDNEELQQLYDSHIDSRKQLHAFFLLRLAMAPVVEAVVMLDRLFYLQENGIEDAYLTQLFDPVVSPRCFAIIAFNKLSDNGGTDSAR